MKYQFIEANQRCYPVRAMCKALQVSASGYYASRSRALSTRSQRQNLLPTTSALFIATAVKRMVRHAFMRSFQRKGLPAVKIQLPS